jgi:type I restriction enzyme M protein
MWRRVELHNFRSIEHVKVDLAPFTLLVGPNGSGKSNFVDAIAFAGEATHDAEEAIAARGGFTLVRRWMPHPADSFRISVRAANASADLDGKYWQHVLRLAERPPQDWSFAAEGVAIPGTDGKPRIWRRDDRKPPIVLDAELEVPFTPTSSVFLTLRQKYGEETFAPLMRVRRFRFSPDLMHEPSSLDRPSLAANGSNLSAAVRDVIKDSAAADRLRRTLTAILPGTTGITVDEAGGFGILGLQQWVGESSASFRPKQLSDGTLRVLATVVAVEQMQKDQLLIIEEPETGLHPGAAAALFDVLKDAAEKGSVLITTHSPELLDLAEDEEILVCESRDGTTRIGPLAESQRALVRDGLFSISELMRSSPLRIEGTDAPTLDPRTLHS